MSGPEVVVVRRTDGAPSTSTLIVDPLIGIIFGSGVSAHPKFTKFVARRHAALRRRIDRPKRLRRARVRARHRPRPKQRRVPVAILRQT